MSNLKSTKNRLRSFWPHIRGILIIFHIIAVFVMSFPAPVGVHNKKAWQDPSVVSEMQQWASNFRELGINVSDRDFTDFLWRLSGSYNHYRGKILKPFEPYMKWSGAEQSWRMFSAPHRYPVTFAIEIFEAGRWRYIYQMRSDKYNWRGDFFDHHRIRRLFFLFGWKKHGSSYKKLTKWLAKKAAADFIRAEKIRFTQVKYKTLPPEMSRQSSNSDLVDVEAVKKLKPVVIELKKYREKTAI